MTRLILVRHGNTFEQGETPLQVGAKTDLPLTAYGLLQAEAVGKYLSTIGVIPQVIYAGRLKRQTESAQVIAQLFGLSLQKSPALNEIDYGLWEGLTANEIQKTWPKEYAEWNEEAKWQGHIFQGSDKAHFKQLLDWLEFLKQAHFGKTVLAVTSNGLLRFLKNEKVKTGHFCEVILEEKGYRIVQWNQKPEGFS
jgi:2,3-bisphosphoglycerate-dependent phosphoglycerate mutase